MNNLNSQVAFDKAVSFLKSEKIINRSYVAERMYPDVKRSSANAKFHNKLREHSGFRFTEKEQVRLTQVLTSEFSRIAELLV